MNQQRENCFLIFPAEKIDECMSEISRLEIELTGLEAHYPGPFLMEVRNTEIELKKCEIQSSKNRLAYMTYMNQLDPKEEIGKSTSRISNLESELEALKKSAWYGDESSKEYFIDMKMFALEKAIEKKTAELAIEAAKKHLLKLLMEAIKSKEAELEAERMWLSKWSAVIMSSEQAEMAETKTE